MEIRSRTFKAVTTSATLVTLSCSIVQAQPDSAVATPPEATEIWEPVPAVVEPGPYVQQLEPPADAIILFDGTDLDQWVNVRDGAPGSWVIEDGLLTVDKAVGDIQTRRRFGSYQLHLEWRVPEQITGSGQSRGNSGLFLASTGSGGYELQILDAYANTTYVNGMAGSVYKQSIPLVNPARPPGEWQTYDVIWTAPEFNTVGTLLEPARITAIYNGILVQNNFELRGDTRYIGEPQYRAHGDSPIRLQAHGDPSPPISFRNIWVRPLP